MKEYNTKQRAMILSVFRSNPAKSFTAREVSGLLPGIALATVYRVIHRLSGDGYLMKVPSGQEALFQYRNPESCSGHLHIKCSRCGCVWHIDDSISSVISREIVDACGFELLNSSMLEGICPACREGKKP